MNEQKTNEKNYVIDYQQNLTEIIIIQPKIVDFISFF